MVRAAQKGEMKNPSDEVLDVADDISVKDAKKFAKTKHKGLPNKKEVKEGASILKVRGKRNTYKGPTGDHRRDEEGNIVASFYNKKPAPTGNKGKKIDYKKPKRDLVAMRARKKARREEREARARERAASVNEEKLLEKLGSWKQDVQKRDKAAKSIKTGKSPSHKARRRKRSKPGGTEKLSDVNKAGERKSMQSVGGFRGAHGASRKSKSSQGPAARIEYKRKSPADAPKKHDAESVKKVGTFVSLRKKMSESKIINEAERNWYKGYDSGDKTVPRRKAMDRSEYFDNRGENERADKIRSIAAKKDQGRHYEAKKDAKKIKISNKIGKLRTASIDDKRGAVSGDVQKKLKESVLDRVVKHYRDKKKKREPEKSQDAGARARRLLARKEYASKVSGSTENVPDDIRDHKNWDNKKHI